jgi:hypothetical protein
MLIVKRTFDVEVVSELEQMYKENDFCTSFCYPVVTSEIVAKDKICLG